MRAKVITWYKRNMPSSPGGEKPKKIDFIGLKVGGPDKEDLIEISKEHDRPLGYVARELMLRGLAAYRRDGKLKETETSRATRPHFTARAEDRQKQRRKGGNKK